MRKNAFLWVENVLKEICKKNEKRERERGYAFEIEANMALI